MLLDILPSFWNRTELYHTLMCLLLGVSVAIIPEHMTLDLLESFVIFKAPDHHIACIDALPIIFAMLRNSHEAANEDKGRSKIINSGNVLHLNLFSIKQDVWKRIQCLKRQLKFKLQSCNF
jgi:hypothetical protein